MTSCLRFYHTAALFGVIILTSIASSFSSAAPLCSQVLRSFTQEQIDSTIEDFTRLTIQADEAKAQGQQDALSRSIRSSQRAKENELIQTLNISREELRKLVRARSAILEKKLAEDAEAKNKAVAKEAELFREKTFMLEKHMDTDQTYPRTTIEPVANATRLLIKSSSNHWIGSLAAETPIPLSGLPEGILPDAVFTWGFTTDWGITVTNFHTTAQTNIIFKPSSKIVSSDKQSMVFSESYANAPFMYLHLDINGKTLHEGTLPDLKGAEVKYAGQKDWLLRQTEGFSLFNPQTKALKPLGIAGSSIVKDLHHGRVAIKEGKRLYILDTNSDQWTSKEIPEDFEMSFSSDKFIWLKFNRPWTNIPATLRSFDINTLEEVPSPTMYVEKTFAVQSFEKSDMISVSEETLGGTEIQKGIYRNDNLYSPIFNTSEIYSGGNFSIKHQTLSDDGSSLIIVGTNRSSGEEKYFIDVYKLK